MPFASPRLMLVTDRHAARGPLVATVAAAVSGGVDVVQVREPDLAPRDLLTLVRELLTVTRPGGTRLVVNDRLDVALAAGADGAHLRRSSIPAREARRVLGPDRILGVSTHSPEEVTEALCDGADYVVFGPVFPTPSKEGILEPRGIDLYREVAASAPGPVLALGGVSPATLSDAGGAVSGIAAIRALLDQDDPAAAARKLRAFLAPAEATR